MPVRQLFGMYALTAIFVILAIFGPGPAETLILWIFGHSPKKPDDEKPTFSDDLKK
jgi:hypothetical protein